MKTHPKYFLFFFLVMYNTKIQAQYNPGAGLEDFFNTIILVAIAAFALIVFVIYKSRPNK